MPCSGRLLPGAVIACLAQASHAQRQLVELALPIDRALVCQLSAPPRKFVEPCTKLQPGTVLGWSFESEAPATFNIRTYFLVEGAVMYPKGLSAVTAAEGRTAPGASQDCCWLWSNA